MAENDKHNADNHRYAKPKPTQAEPTTKTETPANPYRSPKTNVPSLKPRKRKLTALDWILAFILASSAASFVFLTTCMGGVFLLKHPEIKTVRQSALFALFAAGCVTFLVLRFRSSRKSR